MNFKKGEIIEHGDLYINNNPRYCPRQLEIQITCGDWCVLFGEPMQHENGYGFPKWELEICEKTLTFDEFVDERGKE